MLTLVTWDRQRLFGAVVDGQMRLSAAGMIAQDLWVRTEHIRKNIKLDEFVIMPDHMHAILWIADDKGNFDFSKYTDIRTEKGRTFGGQTTNSLAAIIGTYKSAVTRLVRVILDRAYLPVWQRNYHESIIVNELRLIRCRRYILDNPKNWKESDK